MKKLLILFLSIIVGVIVNAQPTNQQRIEDSVVGWEKIYSFKGKQYKPLVVEGKTFSAYQQSIRDTFITWFQRTYAPIGSQGTIADRNFTNLQSRGPVPQGIGADFLVWSVDFDKSGKTLHRISETAIPVFIFTNNLQGINYLRFLSSPEKFFFSMPKENYQSTFNDKKFIELVKDYGLHNGDKFSKYLVYFTGTYVTVVLTPKNELPFVALTKGEFLRQCDAGLVRQEEIVKQEAKDRYGNDPRYLQEEYKRIETDYKPRWQKTLAMIKEKYKSRLNEPAILKTVEGPSVSGLYNGDDFFEEKDEFLKGFQVYRYADGIIEKSKQDKPLWISITWIPVKADGQFKQKYLHNAMLRYFNFDYVYDYFFNPEKIKGTAYFNLNAEEQKQMLAQLRSHWNVPDKKLADGVFFADDFSKNADGSKPLGWFSSAYRKQATVVSLKDKPGKWVQLGAFNPLTPSTSLKDQLPENFTCEFDVLTDQFNARTGGAVNLVLTTYQLDANGNAKQNDEGLSILLTTVSGNENDYNNNNYSGASSIKITRTSPSINVWHHSETFNTSYALKEYTNRKNKVHIALKVKNGDLKLLINDKLVVQSSNLKTDDGKTCDKCLPAGTRFKNLSFENKTQQWGATWGDKDPINVYISNVRITKD